MVSALSLLLTTDRVNNAFLTYLRKQRAWPMIRLAFACPGRSRTHREIGVRGDPGLGLPLFFFRHPDDVPTRVRQFAFQSPPFFPQIVDAIQLLGSVPELELNSVLGPRMRKRRSLVARLQRFEHIS